MFHSVVEVESDSDVGLRSLLAQYMYLLKVLLNAGEAPHVFLLECLSLDESHSLHMNAFTCICFSLREEKATGTA